MIPRRLKGHTLRKSGKTESSPGAWTNDAGPGQCSCGTFSPDLRYSSHRRRWHAAHKAHVMAGGTGDVAARFEEQSDEVAQYIRSVLPDPEGVGHVPGRPGLKPTRVAERFFKFVNLDGPCWEWKGATGRTGYGSFGFNGKNHRAHRVAWTLLVGAVPDGLVLDHLCRVRNCVNPDHLEPVTQEENLRRSAKTKQKRRSAAAPARPTTRRRAARTNSIPRDERIRQEGGISGVSPELLSMRFSLSLNRIREIVGSSQV